MSKTAVISIGNSDNKLTQMRWSYFVEQVDTIVDAHALQTHFRGFSPGDEAWQNACWMLDIDEADLTSLRESLAGAAKLYEQDSIALIVGETEFVS